MILSLSERNVSQWMEQVVDDSCVKPPSASSDYCAPTDILDENSKNGEPDERAQPTQTVHFRF